MNNSKLIAIETDKKYNNVIIKWTEDKIKKAFNFGNGTVKDFNNYVNNNRQFAKFKFI
ncbi:MAG TPA: hypothetical protein VIK86_07920 [Candidatus Paceibacterota bacterium]